MRRPLVTVGTLAAVLGVTLGGCSRSGDPTTPARTFEPQVTASSPSPKVIGSGSEACKLLSSKERRSIAGERVDRVTPVASRQGDRQCRWIKEPSKPLPAIEVVTSPAREWVTLLPQLIDGMVTSGRADQRFSKRLQEAKKKVLMGADTLGDGEACDMFSLLAHASGGKKGASEIGHYQGAESGELIATVQKCTRGVHTLLTYSEPNLTPSDPLTQAMLRLVRIAHERAVKLL